LRTAAANADAAGRVIADTIAGGAEEVVGGNATVAVSTALASGSSNGTETEDALAGKVDPSGEAGPGAGLAPANGSVSIVSMARRSSSGSMRTGGLTVLHGDGVNARGASIVKCPAG
jgi:hypothetical protein